MFDKLKLVLEKTGEIEKPKLILVVVLVCVVVIGVVVFAPMIYFKACQQGYSGWQFFLIGFLCVVIVAVLGMHFLEKTKQKEKYLKFSKEEWNKSLKDAIKKATLIFGYIQNLEEKTLFFNEKGIEALIVFIEGIENKEISEDSSFVFVVEEKKYNNLIKLIKNKKPKLEESKIKKHICFKKFSLADNGGNFLDNNIFIGNEKEQQRFTVLFSEKNKEPYFYIEDLTRTFFGKLLFYDFFEGLKKEEEGFIKISSNYEDFVLSDKLSIFFIDKWLKEVGSKIKKEEFERKFLIAKKITTVLLNGGCFLNKKTKIYENIKKNIEKNKNDPPEIDIFLLDVDCPIFQEWSKKNKLGMKDFQEERSNAIVSIEELRQLESCKKIGLKFYKKFFTFRIALIEDEVFVSIYDASYFQKGGSIKNAFFDVFRIKNEKEKMMITRAVDELEKKGLIPKFKITTN